MIIIMLSSGRGITESSVSLKFIFTIKPRDAAVRTIISTPITKLNPTSMRTALRSLMHTPSDHPF